MTVPDPPSLFTAKHYSAVSSKPSSSSKQSPKQSQTAARRTSEGDMAKIRRGDSSMESNADTPKKDLRHLDSRLGVNAALKVEKEDTRWDACPRFAKPPPSSYSDRARPNCGTCNDEMDNVLADVLYGRPVSQTESRRIKDNRMTQRMHSGPRGGSEFFVASFQQRGVQDECSTNVQVARRVLMSSKSSLPDPSCDLRPLPWFRQPISQVNGYTSPTTKDQPRRCSSEEPKPRILNGSATPSNGLSPWPKVSGRPPPSTGSARGNELSAENLAAYERSISATPRSARGSREGSQASRHSSRGSRRKCAGGSGASNRSESRGSRASVRSAPPRQINWDHVIASAQVEGGQLRAASADTRPAGKVADDAFSSPALRLLRAPGEFSPRVHSQSQSDVKEYRRCRNAGRPPPSMLQGVFDREAELASQWDKGYRRMRSARTPSPCDKLPMPLGLYRDSPVQFSLASRT